MRNQLLLVYLFSTVFLFAPLSSIAQENTDETDTIDKEEKAAATVPSNETDDRTQLLKQQLAAQQEQINEMKKIDTSVLEKIELQQQREETLQAELEETREELEMVSMMGMEDSSDERLLTLYGFFDVTFFKQWYKNNNSIAKAQQAPHSTFLMNNINVYVKSEMTDSLEAMLETRLSFAPLGTQTNVPLDVYVGGERDSSIMDNGEYVRTDTRVVSYTSMEEYRYGSISIVRAYFDWKPRDWFSVRAGRYLTPFGIWNEEHAATVLTGIYLPGLIYYNVVPASQMGLSLYGSKFLTDNFNLKYALTISNGRGPLDTVLDLDENKAFGVRLKGKYKKSDFKISFGGYGYFGQYTDVERRVQLHLDSNYEPVKVDGSILGSEIEKTVQYKEFATTADLSIEYKGVKLFGEYGFRRVNYDIPIEQSFFDQLLENQDVTDRQEPSYVFYTAYGVLSWTLPLDKFISPVSITPYGGYDWVNSRDHLSGWSIDKSARFGVNIKPSPFFVFKIEGIMGFSLDSVGGNRQNLSVQAAVSF